MVDRTKINESLTVGNVHPSAEQLEQLARDGFQAVVNLRSAGESGQPLTPSDEGRKVEELGMRYLHFPVTSDDLRAELVDEFREQVATLPDPVFVHCKSGTRSGALVMMHVAAKRGWDGQQTLEKAKEMGFECDTPELEKFVTTYVDQRRQAV